jgi:Raf kinase inhibitor-like YbhB/YbcL family protein
MPFLLKARDFDAGGPIPEKFTCDGTDVSPALEWTAPPDGTAAFALIVDDPDAPAGTWVHWLLYDIPANQLELPEGVETAAQLPSGARQGRNDFRRIGYGGPCPPPGTPHHYHFRLFALKSAVGLRPGVARAALDEAMRGRVLATAELVGLYQRKGRRRS